MGFLTYFVFLQSLIPLLVLSASIPDTSLTITQPVEHNLTSVGATFLCRPQPGFRTVVFPTTADCAAALRALPSSPDVGIFHTGGSSDGFQLPVFERYRKCEVLIEGSNGRSSWLEIGLAAIELNMACLESGPASNTGGTTYVSPYNRIKITLRGYPLR